MTQRKYNESYKPPQGIDDNLFYALIDEFINLAKDKGLTVRQAQSLFISCSDAILDININGNNRVQKNDLINDISKSLSDIAKYTGIISTRR